MLKLLLNISYPVPRNTMTISSNDSNCDLEDDHKMRSSEFESMMGYLEYRDIRNPSLLYGLSSKNSAKSADIASIYFGLQELQNIYPLVS